MKTHKFIYVHVDMMMCCLTVRLKLNMLSCDDFMSSGQRLYCPACLHLLCTLTHSFPSVCHCQLTLLMCKCILTL